MGKNYKHINRENKKLGEESYEEVDNDGWEFNKKGWQKAVEKYRQ
jgi:hypothetical protein